MKIGIIGKGFVGTAVEYGFKTSFNKEVDIKVFDKDKTKCTHTLFEVVNNSEYVFISVPTPSFEDGSIDLSILEEVLNSISKISENKNTIFLVRSTIVPGSTSFFQKKFPNIRLVFNPEFLTERNANHDFINQERFIFGGNKNDTERVEKLFIWRFGKDIPIIKTNFETAELIKYMNNTFLATKVSFLNEMKILSDACGADWGIAIEGFSLDSRVGNSHLQVPGIDGKKGFGGSCFPKDIQAITNFADSIEIDLKVLKAAWKTNLKVRPEKDWEKLVGRAVTSKKKG
tara:strand:+ start:348 stop:1208 length:861 start_codon:yes stop_codon:yes gene_type:complete